MSDEYIDIINLEYKKSDKHPHMSIRDRAAQFAPFSALTGYSDTVNEVGRFTNDKVFLDEYEIQSINRELQYVFDNIKNSPEVAITYFVPDDLKAGGEYRTVEEHVNQVYDFEKIIELASGEKIKFEQIVSIYVKTP